MEKHTSPSGFGPLECAQRPLVWLAASIAPSMCLVSAVGSDPAIAHLGAGVGLEVDGDGPRQLGGARRVCIEEHARGQLPVERLAAAIKPYLVGAAVRGRCLEVLDGARGHRSEVGKPRLVGRGFSGGERGGRGREGEAGSVGGWWMALLCEKT